MSLLGVDLNATRARAVSGPPGDFPCVVPLDPPHDDLPLMLSLEGRTPEVGTAGSRLCRRSPHLAFHGFLPHLGQTGTATVTAGRHRLDSAGALTLIFERLRRVCRGSLGLVLGVPAYLTTPQVDLLLTLAQKAGLPLVGSCPTPLAQAMAAYAEQPWFGTVLIVDVDDHALSVSPVCAADGQAELLTTRTLPHLGLRAWRERILNALADCCILQSRRDPRDSPAAEQTLYEQIDNILDAARQGRMVHVAFQTPQWYQNIVLQPADTLAFCAALTRQALAEIEALFNAPWPGGLPEGVLVTASAARLPGLLSALGQAMSAWGALAPPARKQTTGLGEEDFGAGLLQEETGEPASVVVLSPDAAARAAHALAALFHRGELPCGHLERAAPLPLPQPVEAGPARLHYQGQDYLLSNRPFTLGRQPSCELVFDADQFPAVSPRHCEIIFEHWAYVLYDRSREGTLVNDSVVKQSVVLRPGDWIRLGPSGPLLRFVGQPADYRPMTTIA